MDILNGHTPVQSARARSKPFVSTEQQQHKRRNYVVGVALFLIVALLWTASGFVTQVLYKNGYDKPFLVTYISTGPFALYLVPRSVRWLWRAGRDAGQSSKSTVGYQQLATSDIPERLDYQGPIISFARGQAVIPAAGEKGEDGLPLTAQQTASVAFAFCWLWFIANWAINAALNYTTVANSTIIASTSGFFTLGIGRMFGVERFSRLKVLAVLICFMGVIVVSLSDSQFSNPADHPTLGLSPALPSPTSKRGSQPLLGDGLAFISALFYALYVVFLKVKVQVESRIDMQLFLGFVGLFNLLTCWPVGVVLHWVGMEIFEPPRTSIQWYALLINMAILVLSDYLYVLSMLKTTPLLVTIGISLTIPIAVTGDFILNAPVRSQVMIGAILVLISFTAIGLDGWNTERDKTREEDSRTPSEI